MPKPGRSPPGTRIQTSYEPYPSLRATALRGYLTRPAKHAGKRPTVLVVHENQGLNPHIEDIARRLALDNFIALAPDALSPLGGYPGDEDKARTLFPQLDQTRTRADFLAAVAVPRKLPDGNGKVGGGGLLLRQRPRQLPGHHVPDLNAALAFHGG